MYILHERKGVAKWNRTSLKDFVRAEKGDIISFAGAGGKTTLMMNLARELALSGMRVIVTTTTKMYWQEDAVDSSNLDKIKAVLNESGLAVCGIKAGIKMICPDSTFFEQGINMADVMLVEADGARRLPFKFPREGEPVYLQESNKIVYAAGLTALGKKLGSLARGALMADFLGRSEDDQLSDADMAKVLGSASGGKKDVADRQFFLILNQADDEQTAGRARQIIEEISPVSLSGAAYSCCRQDER